MRRKVRNLLAVAVAVAAMLGATAAATSTPLPTEFTSGGVLWGDLTGDNTGFYNGGQVCNDADGFAMGDANLLSPDQSDTFDDTGIVTVAGTPYVVPGGVNGPVDLTGATITAPPAPTGPLTVGVEWQGAGTGTIRELVTLTNPGATDVSTVVTIENNVGSDGSTRLQASSTGDISGYPSTARWFVTSDSDTTPSDPVVVSVAAGPGAVVSPDAVVDCPQPVQPDGASSKQDAKGANTTDGSTTTSGDGVTASGTPLATDQFQYVYNVTVPAGQTRYLMVFWALYATNAEGIAAGPTWNTNPAAGSPALTGVPAETGAGATASDAGDVSALSSLTPLQLSQILNWNFGPVPVVVTPRFTG